MDAPSPVRRDLALLLAGAATWFAGRGALRDAHPPAAVPVDAHHP